MMKIGYPLEKGKNDGFSKEGKVLLIINELYVPQLEKPAHHNYRKPTHFRKTQCSQNKQMNRKRMAQFFLTSNSYMQNKKRNE